MSAFDPEKLTPDAFQFLTAWFADEEADETSDGEIVRNYASTVDAAVIKRVVEQLRSLAEHVSFSHEVLADVTDLHFENKADGREWLTDIAELLEDAAGV